MTEYTNTLDQWYGSCPGPVQQVLQSPYQQISEMLQWLTGEPNTIAAQCSTYATQGASITACAESIREVQDSMTGWTGEAHTAFDAKMEQLGSNFDQLGEAVTGTREILIAAAETCVEASNMVIDVVRMVIEFLLASLAIAIASAVFTLGASFAAWVASNLANGARALAQIMSGLTKVARVLEKIAQIMQKIAAFFKKVAEVLKQLKEVIKVLKELKKGEGFGTKLYLSGLQALAKAPVKIGANGLILGAESATGADIPSRGSAVTGGGGNLADHGGGARNSSDDAVDAGRQNRPPGH